MAGYGPVLWHRKPAIYKLKHAQSRLRKPPTRPGLFGLERSISTKPRRPRMRDGARSLIIVALSRTKTRFKRFSVNHITNQHGLRTEGSSR